ncbi:AHH domain-containing protein [Paenibacillus sp. M1]|uniref:AHH domain-containing protein n=1 Tax=Paenibacillus haidiansis TaxID=1574488 RepID=A0ABU7VXX8_9BACL
MTETAGSIKEKVAILGKPALLMKTIANKAVDMVLNFIITHPPSALIKAVFKGIEAVAGKSIVELVRQYIPFADKLFDKIAASGPVQGLMKPLEQPVQQVGGMIDQVTDGATGMVDDAEQKAGSFLSNGSKLLTELSGASAAGPGQEGAKAQGPGQGGKGGAKESAEGEGGDFLGTVKSGIHVRLLSIGKRLLLQSGKKLVLAGADKAKDFVAGLMVQFNIANESHKLWIEKQGNRNVVMMASTPEKLRKKLEDYSTQAQNIDDNAKKGNIVDCIERLNQEITKIEALSDTKEAKIKLKELSKEVSKVGTTIKFEVKGFSDFDFGKHLRSLIGDPPSGMVDPHAHHILFKEGHGEAQKALVKKGQELLRRYNIDPIFGKENLIWAPNRIKGQHAKLALQNVVEQLIEVENMGGSPERIRTNLIKKLNELGELAARRT